MEIIVGEGIDLHLYRAICSQSKLNASVSFTDNYMEFIRPIIL